ncbi:hypothetical protein FACS1894176_04150 [Bacteroidia bacterium]|nr:hypothetical protein FACS1894176_04150 [Bacteroidia bacterium]
MSYYDDCFPVSGTKEVKAGNYPIVITQLNDGTVQFDFEKLNISSIEIYNSSGVLQKLFEKERLNIILPAKTFLQGVYFYRAISEDGDTYTGKFIVR